MWYNCSLLDTPPGSSIASLGLLDERKLCQTVHAARTVFELLTGARVSGPAENLKCYYHRVRGINEAVSFENTGSKRARLDPFAKSLAEFVDGALSSARAAKAYRLGVLQKENQQDTLRQLLRLPNLYRAFREQAALKLARTC